MKTERRNFFNLAMLVSCFFVGACASNKTYQPEVGGAGSISSHGDVVFSIPPENPVIKMKLISMVTPKENAVHVRMYFHRIGAPAGEYLDPREQSLALPDSSDVIQPNHVYASAAGKPMIKLTDSERQWIELVFPLPDTKSQKYSFLKLNWKLHYKTGNQSQIAAQTERFDYVSKKEHQASAGPSGDLEFPAGELYGPMPDEWETPGWVWW